MMGNNQFIKMIGFSIIFHLFLFSSFLINFPTKRGVAKKIYYVDLIEIKSGGGGSKGGGLQKPPSGSMRELTVKKEPEPKSVLRYPVKKPKNEPENKKTVISRPEKSGQKKETTFDPSKKELTTGLGEGFGSGEGFGTGEGGIPGFPYYYYIQILRDKVSSNWFKALVPPGLSGVYRVVIFFKIKRNGEVDEIKIEESSGIESLDLSALRAVKFSIPFPPLPREYEGDYLGVHFQFEYRK